MAKYSLKEKDGKVYLYRGNKVYCELPESVPADATITIVEDVDPKSYVEVSFNSMPPIMLSPDLAQDSKPEAKMPKVDIDTIRKTRRGKANASRKNFTLLDQRRAPKEKRLEDWIQERRRKGVKF